MYDWELKYSDVSVSSTKLFLSLLTLMDFFFLTLKNIVVEVIFATHPNISEPRNGINDIFPISFSSNMSFLLQIFLAFEVRITKF